MSDQPDKQEQDPVASARLVEELRALYNEKLLVPSAVDDTILSQARAHLQSMLSTLERSADSHIFGSRIQRSDSNSARHAGTRAQWLVLHRSYTRAQFVPFSRWLAAAAVVMVIIGLVFLLNRDGSVRSPAAREDIDRNGQVDILDAFALARKLQQGPTSDSALDVNGDGLIDERDIDWIAAHAVKLHKG